MTLFDPEDLDVPTGPVTRVRMTVAYDGAGFHGSADNPGVRTVVGTLREALAKVLATHVDMAIAGRTDAGVHALGQVVSFDAPVDRLDVATLARSLNRITGPDVAVLDVREVDGSFDARHSAIERRYRYRVLAREEPDPLRHGRVWHVAVPLDRRAMAAACSPLIGEHDFSSFCRRPKNQPDAALVRRITHCRVVVPDTELIEVEVRANAFCHQMVRSLVGLLVSVGEGKLRAGDVRRVIDARDRSAVPRIAPPDGLVLERVVYPDDPDADEVTFRRPPP